MNLHTIHCFLVRPSKSDLTQPEMGGTLVRTRGKLYDMLEGIFQKAHSDCNIDIAFSHDEHGKQNNDCRDLLDDYIQSYTIENARPIAHRLHKVTSQKSGLGLLFLMTGSDGERWRLLLSRFPADQGILAEEHDNTLTVEFLEKVFMKSATSYKAVFYEGAIHSRLGWKGKAVDKQINYQGDHLAKYWISDYLLSTLRTTSEAGTRRLAIALREALKNSKEADQKAAIMAAVTLAPGIDGRTLNVTDFCNQFGLTGHTADYITAAIGNEALAEDAFKFSIKEFRKSIAFRSVEMDNGGVLTANVDDFESVFQRVNVSEKSSIVKFSTEGRIVDERIRKNKT